MKSLHYMIAYFLSFRILLAVHAAPHAAREVKQSNLGEKQLPSWVGGAVDSPSSLDHDDMTVFLTDLSGVRIDQKLSVGGINNRALYLLKDYNPRKNPLSRLWKSFKGQNMIMKVLYFVNNASYGEVKALKAVGDLVDSGLVKLSTLGSKSFPVIIMREKPGEVLYRHPGYIAADASTRKTLQNETFFFMCDKVADVAANFKIFHADNHPDNILVTLDSENKKVLSVELVDYGPPRTYWVAKTVTKMEVFEQCVSKREIWYSLIPT